MPRISKERLEGFERKLHAANNEYTRGWYMAGMSGGYFVIRDATNAEVCKGWSFAVELCEGRQAFIVAAENTSQDLIDTIRELESINEELAVEVADLKDQLWRAQQGQWDAMTPKDKELAIKNSIRTA